MAAIFSTGLFARAGTSAAAVLADPVADTVELRHPYASQSLVAAQEVDLT